MSLIIAPAVGRLRRVLLISLLIAACHLSFGAVASRIASRKVLATSEGSSCVSKISGYTLKPKGSNWSKKVQDASVDECLEKCEADDGYVGVAYNNDNEDCYCWKGEAEVDWVWVSSDSDDTYIIQACSDDYQPAPEPSGPEIDTKVNQDGLIEDYLGRIRGDLEPFGCGEFDGE
eukprot:scaffold109652_cov33-Prasinocladus_malaysianus.AAC.1